MFLEQALKTWKRKCENMEIPIDDLILYTLCFAEDQIVLVQNQKWGLEVNIKKTSMGIGGE